MVTSEDVSFAKVEDLVQLAAFAYNTYKEVDLDVSPPDFDVINATVLDCIINHVPLVIRNPHNPALLDACLLMNYSSSWWSSETVLHQLFFYVKPGARNGENITALLDAAKEYGTMNNLAVVQDIVGRDFARKTNLLKRKGYKQIGASLIFK